MQSNSFISNLAQGIGKRLRGFTSGKNKKAGINWANEKFLKHAAPGKTRHFTLKGKRVYFSSPSEFLHTLKEIFVAEIYKANLPANAYIIDCGANIGLSTLYFKMQSPNAEIVAFEPDDRNFELLLKNIQSFDLKGVTARKEAVWIADTQINFSSDGTMGSKIETNSVSNVKSVKAMRLNDLLVRQVDFLKIDIEGAEYEVLKDIADNLDKVKNMFLEYHGTFKQNSELTELFDLLTRVGFSYYIKEAANIYENPFIAREMEPRPTYDVQLNIFCFR